MVGTTDGEPALSPTHHAAVESVWEALEGGEYRPFSGYGGSSQHYGRCTPWRGRSNIPHHVAVESREDGETNGRLFFAPSPSLVAPRKAPQLNGVRVFRMDVHHAAVSSDGLVGASR